MVKKSSDVDAYISRFDGEAKSRLLTLRDLVCNTAPDAEEGIMYGLAGYKYNKKPLIYFGGFTNHIGVYATPDAHEIFADKLSTYKRGKGSVQFPLDQPLPVDLVKQMVLFNKKQLEV